MIDWKGKSEIDKKEKINESAINVYFKGIFQSVKTKNNPCVTDIVESLNIHQIIIPVLDETPDFKKIILLLVQNIFFGKYPQVWKSQMLHDITKPGHTYNCPQLRGISVSQLLCRI